MKIHAKNRLVTKNINLPKTFRHEWARGSLVKLLWRANLLDLSVIQYDNLIADLKGFLLIVCHKQACHMTFIVQSPEPDTQFVAHLGVKGAKWFIEH